MAGSMDNGTHPTITMANTANSRSIVNIIS